MSRWSKKSDEEKKALLKKMEENKEKQHKSSKDYAFSQEMQGEILGEHELPLMCDEHGWVKSVKYELFTGEMPITRTETTMVAGTCPICGRKLTRALPVSLMASDGGMLIMMIIPLLLRQGRLVDRR